MKSFLKNVWVKISPGYRALKNLEVKVGDHSGQLEKLGFLIRTQGMQQACDVGALLSPHSGVTGEKRDPKVIVSLTTIPSRVAQVHLVIESIFQQSLKADSVVLWLDHESFDDFPLSDELLRMRERGLEIRYCDNIRSYKKLIPILMDRPEAILVTTDDDIIYPRSWLEKLFMAQVRHPGCVICHRAHQIQLDKEGKVLPYEKWNYETEETGPSLDLFPTGSGGVLYPPGSLHPEVLKEEVFFEICRTQDDLWFKAMTLYQGTPTVRVDGDMMFDANLMVIDGSQEEALWKVNRKWEENFKQVTAVFEKYGLNELLKRPPH